MVAGCGPLAGIRVLELAGLGPGPFAGMVLGDLGAEVLQVDRLGQRQTGMGALNRGKRSVGLDLKAPDGVATFLRLCEAADVVIEVFRPGVAERLGVGPDECRATNPRLVYARLTGFGQAGPLAHAAGHDIDYLATAGVLDLLGRADGPPTPPVNMLADFAGGGMLCALGVVSALLERTRSGGGQVVDAAMVDGAALMAAPFVAGRANGGWGPRGTNMLDGAAPFYDSYRCADGRWLAVGAIEPQFYANLVRGLGLDRPGPGGEPALAADEQYDQSAWPATRERVAATISTRTRDEWVAQFEGIDACVAPVLDPVEAVSHPHAVARGAFVAGAGGLPEPSPAPRFSTSSVAAGPPLADTEDPVDVLTDWGFDAVEARSLTDAGVLT